jgi:hypothetical protein
MGESVVAAIGVASATVGTVLGNVWSKLRLVVKAEDAINDVPQLRQEFEDHCEEDRGHHAELREMLVEIRGEQKRIGDNIDWLKRQQNDRR